MNANFHDFFFAYFRYDSESNDDGGQIPFLELNGFNPGEFIEDYEKLLNPGVDWMFQKPKRSSKKFNIHSNEETCYYENSKVIFFVILANSRF